LACRRKPSFPRRRNAHSTRQGAQSLDDPTTSRHKTLEAVDDPGGGQLHHVVSVQAACIRVPQAPFDVPGHLHPPTLYQLPQRFAVVGLGSLQE
jgi:hypothetical protein